MGKKLAILGHSTRGKEVIELLEMMGGSNIHNLSGNDIYAYYIIKGFKNEIHNELYIFGDEDMYFFTLEEFLEKFPYKVGDKVVYTKYGDNCDDYPVTIEAMKWTGTTIEYIFDDCVTCLAKDLKMWNGEHDNNHIEPSKMKNVIAELLEHIKTTPKEELEKEFKEIEEWSNVGPTVEEFMTFCESVNKKPKYPTTYKECEKILGLEDSIIEGCLGYEYKLLNDFQKLLMCRDAYWKIAGEEMDLDKPWEPDNDTEIYNIYRTKNIIRLGGACWGGNCNILEFPTEEMRDAFYKNFDYLIEACKELL